MELDEKNNEHEQTDNNTTKGNDNIINRYKILLQKKEKDLTEVDSKKADAATLRGIYILTYIIEELLCVLGIALVYSAQVFLFWPLYLCWALWFSSVLLQRKMSLSRFESERKVIEEEIQEIKSFNKLLAENKNVNGQLPDQKRLEIVAKKNYINLLESKHQMLDSQSTLSLKSFIPSTFMLVLVVLKSLKYSIPGEKYIGRPMLSDIRSVKRAKRKIKLNEKLKKLLQKRIDSFNNGNPNIEDLSKIEELVERVAQGEDLDDINLNRVLSESRGRHR